MGMTSYPIIYLDLAAYELHYLARDFTAFVVHLIIIAEVEGVVVYQWALTPHQ